MVSRPEKGERRGENLPEENKRKALEMEGATVRLQFWMHRRPGEKGEQWSFRTCPSLHVALFAVSSFFLLSTQGQRSFERISGDRADRRQTHSTPPQTPFMRQEGSVNKCIGTHVSAALRPSLYFKVFARALYLWIPRLLHFCTSSKKRTSLFPSDVAIKCNHSSGVCFPFHGS